MFSVTAVLYLSVMGAPAGSIECRVFLIFVWLFAVMLVLCLWRHDIMLTSCQHDRPPLRLVPSSWRQGQCEILVVRLELHFSLLILSGLYWFIVHWARFVFQRDDLSEEQWRRFYATVPPVLKKVWWLGGWQLITVRLKDGSDFCNAGASCLREKWKSLPRSSYEAG